MPRSDFGWATSSGNRRDWLRRVAGAGLAANSGLVFGRSVRDEDSPEARLIVRGDRPLNLETPLEAFDTWLTPVDRFFVRSHFGPPAVTNGPWTVEVGGLVEKPFELRIDPEQETGPFARSTMHAVLQCAGNGRALFDPVIPGVGWQAGAVGNGQWTGLLLSDVLQAARVRTGAAHVHFYGADAPPHPKTPAFVRSLQLDRALASTTILATHQNGEPLSVLHGGPVRLIVPGWTGNHWMKWVRSIVVSDTEAPGFYQRTGYKMPKTPVPPGETPKPEDLHPVTELNIKSLITFPSENGQIRAGEQVIRGVAWTGQATVNAVEVSVDDGLWQPAELVRNPYFYSWRQWNFAWRAEPGKHTIRARAHDDAGNVQPDKTPWNKSGYLWNGIQALNVEVTS